LPPLLDNRHVIALRTLADNLTSLSTSRFDRQSERLAALSVARLIPVAHSFGKIVRPICHAVIRAAQYGGTSMSFCEKNGTFPGIHRKKGLIGEPLRTGKGRSVG
jgi:hypothetical protein